MDENTILVDRLVNGDHSAYDQLLSNHRNMIYKIINSHLLDRGDFSIDIQELFQEASIILYQAAFTYESDKNVKFSSYAYVLIRRRIFNLLRDYSNIYKAEMYSIDNGQYSDRYMYCAVKEDPVSYHKEMEFRRYLEEFIKKITPEERQILYLRGENCSYKDISRRLNISVKTVDNRLAKLRKRLNRYLAE